MLIDGELVEASGGATLESVNPATEQVIGVVPEATADDVDRAVRAAEKAGPAWRDRTWTQRAGVLRQYAQVLEDNLEELAHLDAIDSGNPITSMRADVQGAIGEIRYFAGIAGETKGRTIPSGPDALTFTEFVPYPVVARIVPFNHPIKFASAKSAAPLAAGCPVIVKPGEQTSLSALRLGELVKDLFPAGVFNVITGNGATAGAALAGHPRVPRVAFTGSVATGQRVAALGAEQIKHLSLELGGKNPLIVFPDADIATTAKAAVAAMNLARCMGQSCGSASRIFVHEDVSEEFLTALVEAVRKLKVGDPMDDDTDMGPLAFRAHYDKVMGLIASGVEEGAKLLHGGVRPEGLDTRLLRRADRVRAGGHEHADRPRGDLRPGDVGAHLARLRGHAGAGQQPRRRADREHLDQRHLAGAAHRAADPLGLHLDQRHRQAPDRVAVRRASSRAASARRARWTSC